MPKIGIYAPALNELKHVQAWWESCKDADVICVADTGSTDGTNEKMRELGVQVTDVCITPWRFDYAFNIAMSLLPKDVDICIRLDIDERLPSGWRKLLEEKWTPQTTRFRYTYIWNWTADGKPGLQWLGDRIHARSGYHWLGATHEGLCCRWGTAEVQTICEEFEIHHFPEAKNKKNDLNLLLEAVNEHPHDARIRAYLGREYMYQGNNEKATEVYKEFLGMSWDNAERQQAMCNLSKTDPNNKVFWLKSAAIDAPGHREPLCNLAQHYYSICDWKNCYDAAIKALEIIVNPKDYTCTPEAWGAWPYDLASVSAWNLKLYKEALHNAKLAVDYSPNDVRLKNNLKSIENYIKDNLS